MGTGTEVSSFVGEDGEMSKGARGGARIFGAAAVGGPTAERSSLSSVSLSSSVTNVAVGKAIFRHVLIGILVGEVTNMN